MGFLNGARLRFGTTPRSTLRCEGTGREGRISRWSPVAGRSPVESGKAGVV